MLDNLIGTFCIVNEVNLNMVTVNFSDLIGTFCIVNVIVICIF